MNDVYILDKVLDRIKAIIGVKKFHDYKILVGKDDKLPDVVIFKKIVILMTCVMKDKGKFYPQLFLEEALFLR